MAANCAKQRTIPRSVWGKLDFYFVVALSVPIEAAWLEAKAMREQIANAIVGKVVGWGQWVGSCERKWS